MTELQLKNPWMVAVWPGMGHVALNAGVYLLAKLGMTVISEFESNDLFDVEQVEVKEGIIQAGRRPRNRFYRWSDPDGKRDLVLFLGEAQPPLGKYPFCRQLLQTAQRYGIERLFTFAAMATPMAPDQPSRVFAAATDSRVLQELMTQPVEVLQEGNISGLNGVLLGAAVETGLPGGCLLGEIPHVFAQFPVPKASLAILRIFTEISGITVDLEELEEQSTAVDRQLQKLIAHVEESYSSTSEDEEPATSESQQEPRLQPVDADRIETLFVEAAQDRSRAFELKRELDRLGVFKVYEDRFLDLFKKS
ncbi:MAG: PAC2 family protein [Bacteroidales bacterium]|nr:PAC2 family protein [Bacteroidales bacterium]